MIVDTEFKKKNLEKIPKKMLEPNAISIKKIDERATPRIPKKRPKNPANNELNNGEKIIKFNNITALFIMPPFFQATLQPLQPFLKIKFVSHINQINYPCL